MDGCVDMGGPYYLNYTQKRIKNLKSFLPYQPSPTPINILLSKYCFGSLDAAVRPAIFAAAPFETIPAAGALRLKKRLKIVHLFLCTFKYMHYRVPPKK